MNIVTRNVQRMVKAKKFIYAKPFDGMPCEDNFKIVEEDLPAPKDGEFLAEAVYLSIDPYMRAYSFRLALGETMIGSQLAKITESKNANFPVGKYVVGPFGWRSHTIISEPKKKSMEGTHASDASKSGIYVVPDVKGIPLSLFLGALGMTGNAAYFGLLDICRPKSGETVVITGAGGAVGNHVGQIAKIKGCHVIGFTGTDEKSQWLKNVGFDHVINYKSANLKKALAEAAPRGVDCYFDNVGGEISSIIIQQMNKHGRITVCGSISSYNCAVGELPKATIVQPSVVYNELEMKGFVVSTFADRWMEAIGQNLKWLQEGKLKYRETVTEGFENMTKALIGILQGDNVGKAIVKV